MAGAGLAQGFVRFGGSAHRILTTIHELGPMSYTELVEELDISKDLIGMTLTRLCEARMLFRTKRLPKYVTGFEKTQWLYSLTPPSKRPAYRPATHTERMRHHRAQRARDKQRVPSVFHLGGSNA